MPRRSELLFDQSDTGDNICYTTIMLSIGWVLGVLLAVGIFLVGELPTCHDETVIGTITETVTTTGNSTVMEQIDSQAIVRCVIFDVPAAICMTLGILLFPAILITIIVIRRHRGGDDICAEDFLGLSIIGLGVVAGLMAGVGLILQTMMATQNSTAGGAVLLICVGVAIWIALMCSKCYQQWNEDDTGHTV